MAVLPVTKELLGQREASPPTRGSTASLVVSDVLFSIREGPGFLSGSWLSFFNWELGFRCSRWTFALSAPESLRTAGEFELTFILSVWLREALWSGLCLCFAASVITQ